MGAYTLGRLTSEVVSRHPDLVAPSVLTALTSLGLENRVGVVEIDPELSDTAATQTAYGLAMETLVNCVIVTGKREGVIRTAACLVPATTRANINGLVPPRLDVRKASFLERTLAVEQTGMEFGGITPIGLPTGWPIFVDGRIPDIPLVVVGSGIRRSKLIVPGELFPLLPGALVVPELGRPIET